MSLLFWFSCIAYEKVQVEDAHCTNHRAEHSGVSKFKHPGKSDERFEWKKSAGEDKRLKESQRPFTQNLSPDLEKDV